MTRWLGAALVVLPGCTLALFGTERSEGYVEPDAGVIAIDATPMIDATIDLPDAGPPSADAAPPWFRAAPAPLAVGLKPSDVIATDVDGDRVTDILTANAASDTLSFLRQTAEATTFEQSVIETGATVAYDVEVGDFDGDGNVGGADIAVLHCESDGCTGVGAIVVRTRGMNGELASGRSFDVGDTPNRFEAADLDGDGADELIVSNFRDHDLTIVFPRTSSVCHVSLGSAGGPSGIAVDDVDGDGAPDLAVAVFGLDSNAPGGAVLLLRAPGGDPCRYLPPQIILRATPASDLAFFDLDADGDRDLVVTTTGQTGLHFLKNDDGALEAMQGPLGVETGAGSVGFGRRQGEIFIVTADMRDGVSALNIVARPSPGAAFALAETYPVGRRPFWATSGDIDGDGKDDLAVACQLDNTVWLLFQD